MKVRATIVGKWIKGFFWKRPQFSIDLTDAFEPQYTDISVSRTIWNVFKKGDIILVELIQDKKDGLWYVE
jgi:hypothetical protein